MKDCCKTGDEPSQPLWKKAIGTIKWIVVIAIVVVLAIMQFVKL